MLEGTKDNVIVRLFVSSILYSVSWKTLSVDMHFSFSVSSGERLNSTEMYWLGMAFSVIHWWLTWLLIQYLIGKNDILEACLLKHSYIMIEHRMKYFSNIVIFRYLLIGLGVMISCSDYEQVRNKCRHIVGALPAPWIVNPKDPNANRPEVNTAINKIGLQRFTKFLVTSFSATSTTFSTKCAEDVIKLLKILGAKEEANTMEGKLVEKIN